MAIETPALLLLALLLLTVPLNWLLAALAAGAFHELCHFIALRLLGGRPEGFALGPAGAVLRVTGLTPGREVLCALAGPLGGLLLLPLYRVVPRLALCAAVQSCFNLLPIHPLDGGRALYGCLSRFLPEQTAVIWLRRGEIFTCCLLLGLCLGFRLGAFPVFVVFLVIARAFRRKIPCKLRLPGVQ